METTLRTIEGARSAERAAQTPETRISLVASPPAAARARSLLQDAKRASLEHVGLLEAALESARELSDAIVDAGDLYDTGLHQVARQLSELLLWKSKTLQLLAQRQRASLGL
jgi:hypothetical protein